VRPWPVVERRLLPAGGAGQASPRRRAPQRRTNVNDLFKNHGGVVIAVIMLAALVALIALNMK